MYRVDFSRMGERKISAFCIFLVAGVGERLSSESLRGIIP